MFDDYCEAILLGIGVGFLAVMLLGETIDAVKTAYRIWTDKDSD